MTAPEFAEVPKEIPRDRLERPMIIPPGGGKPVAYTRCTTYVGALEDTYNLGQWMQRMAVAGVASRPDLHLRAASLGLPPIKDGTAKAEAVAKKWDDAMNGVVKGARDAAAASAAATIGTSLHALTEAIDSSQELNVATVPDRYRVHLDSYRAATERLTAVAIEQFLVCDELQVGGTADRIVRIDGQEGLFITDLKTGSISYSAGKIAMQLAVYARSQAYAATGVRTPIEGLRTDRGVVIHLDAKTGVCELHWADLTAAWEAAKVAGWVREWRKRKGLLVPAPELVAPHIPDPTVVAIDVAIANAASAEDLATLWYEAVAQGLWTDAMTEAAKARMNQLSAAA